MARGSAVERMFRSRVALRIALLFIGCAVIPLAALGLLTAHRTTAHLDQQAARQLHYDVKSVAMAGIERLGLVEGQVRATALDLASTSRPMSPSALHLPDVIRGLHVETPDGRPIVMGHVTDRSPLSRDQAAHLQEVGALLTRDVVSGTPQHVLHVRVPSADGIVAAAASLDLARLWNLHDGALLPPATELCLYGGGTPLACSPGAGEVLSRAGALAGIHGNRTLLQAGDREYLASSWSVPLKVRYFADPWTLVMTRPRDVVRAPVRQFVRDFWMVVLATLLLVTSVTIVQVRRTLRPLAELMDGTRRLARREFDRPLHVGSRDEFEDLAAAFNALTAELKQQFAELEDFNLGTLEALARAVDAKSPWTAGHSERVTAVAVAIAREMGLPPADIADIARGGLVHDIGKLGTPAAILDKPGPLTPAERAIMSEHPGRGADILAPIKAYAPLLPMVRSHHERWDGRGYPDGLAGEEIALTARVLSAADAFDAMRSDRPYRAGLPLEVVMQHMVHGAGTQFDPVVVDALVRLTERGELDEALRSTRAVFPRAS